MNNSIRLAMIEGDNKDITEDLVERVEINPANIPKIVTPTGMNVCIEAIDLKMW